MGWGGASSAFSRPPCRVPSLLRPRPLPQRLCPSPVARPLAQHPGHTPYALVSCFARPVPRVVPEEPQGHVPKAEPQPGCCPFLELMVTAHARATCSQAVTGATCSPLWAPCTGWTLFRGGPVCLGQRSHRSLLTQRHLLTRRLVQPGTPSLPCPLLLVSAAPCSDPGLPAPHAPVDRPLSLRLSQGSARCWHPRWRSSLQAAG